MGTYSSCPTTSVYPPVADCEFVAAFSSSFPEEVCSCNLPYPVTVQGRGFWEVGVLNAGRFGTRSWAAVIKHTLPVTGPLMNTGL